jgi:hypothetical protein
MPGRPEERLSQVWDLTREVWHFFQGINAEQRLQRDVAVLIRTQDLADVEKLESVSLLKGKHAE